MKTCETCIWFGQCEQAKACEDYTPSYDNTDEYIEDRRAEFFEEWHEYIEENGNADWL